MQFRLSPIATTLFLLCGVTLASAQDITGRWAGSADSTDEGGIKRQERQSFEITKSEDGKLVAVSIGRNGKPGAPLQIQVDGGKINLYRLLELDGGEHLRWKVTLKDGGKLVGTFSAQHDNPKKWIYDRVGELTMMKVDPNAPVPPAAVVIPK